MLRGLFTFFDPSSPSLFEAIESRDPKKVREILDARPGEIKKIVNRTPPFQKAVLTRNSMEVAIILLDYGADPTAISGIDRTSILSHCHYARSEPFLILALLHPKSYERKYQHFDNHLVRQEQLPLFQGAITYRNALNNRDFNTAIQFVDHTYRKK